VYFEKILAAAKRSNQLLDEADVLRMVKVMRARLQAQEEIQEEDLDIVGSA
jgi:DNA-directed RNA polymerase subunit K/omega